jgi:hypothetical protein
MKSSHLLIGLTLSTIIFFGCYFKGTGYKIDKVNYTYKQPVPEKSYQPPVFRYESFSRGIATPHFHSSFKISSIADSLGAGACAFDANNDGFVDIVTLNGPGRVREYGKKSWWADHPATSLYLNNGEGFFDEFQIAGIKSGTPTMGCAVADFNSDGWLDLVITSQTDNYIAINHNGSFKATILPGGSHFSTSVAVFDYNFDNQPDVYISNYIRYQRHQNTLETSAGFLSNDNFAASKFQGENNTLLVNIGKGNFKETKHPLLTSDLSRTLYTHIQDINDDNIPDLVLANDQGSNNRVFISTQQISESTNYIEVSDHILAQRTSTRSLTPIANEQQKLSLSMPMGSYNLILSPLPQVDRSYSYLDSAKYSTWSTINNPSNSSEFIYINGLMKTSIHNPNITISQKNIIFDSRSKKAESLPNLFASDSSRSGLQIDIENDGDLDLLITNNNGYPALLVNNTNGNDNHNYSKSTTFLGMSQPSTQNTFENSKPNVPNQTSNILSNLYRTSNFSTNSKILSEKPGTFRSAMFNKLINSAYNNSKGKINHPEFLSETEVLLLISFELESSDFLSCRTTDYIKRSFITEEEFIRYKKSFIPLLLSNIKQNNPSLDCSLDATSYSRSKYAHDEILNLIEHTTNNIFIEKLKSTLSKLPVGKM